MKDRTRIRVALVVGSLAGSVVGATVGAGATGGPAPAPTPAAAGAPGSTGAAEPDRVAVVSEILDAFTTGSQAGPGVIGGIARTVVGGQPVPPPGDQVQATLLETVIEIGAQISEQGPPSIDAFREAVAPLACANPVINAGIEALADGFEAAADDFGAAIAPFDLTAVETATFLRGLTAPETAC